tara:strand:+ start:1752 stop:1997 length:246 start_codon:yes stop_codon:yes gene_type:complete
MTTKVSSSKVGFNPIKWSGYGLILVGSVFVVKNFYTLYTMECFSPMMYGLLGLGTAIGGYYVYLQSKNWKTKSKVEIVTTG